LRNLETIDAETAIQSDLNKNIVPSFARLSGGEWGAIISIENNNFHMIVFLLDFLPCGCYYATSLKEQTLSERSSRVEQSRSCCASALQPT